MLMFLDMLILYLFGGHAACCQSTPSLIWPGFPPMSPPVCGCRPLEEVKWLKLKAYHRAMAKLRAAKAQEARDPARRAAQLRAAEAPLDVVPQEEIDKPLQQVPQHNALPVALDVSRVYA